MWSRERVGAWGWGARVCMHACMQCSRLHARMHVCIRAFFGGACTRWHLDVCATHTITMCAQGACAATACASARVCWCLLNLVAPRVVCGAGAPCHAAWIRAADGCMCSHQRAAFRVWRCPFRSQPTPSAAKGPQGSPLGTTVEGSSVCSPPCTISAHTIYAQKHAPLHTLS